MCEELKFRPAQMRFPQPRDRLWTWPHPAGSVHQLDHILINSKWVNSLRNCRAYNSVELNSDHRILSITLSISLRTSRGKPCKRVKFNWNKLRDSAIRKQYQIEVSKKFSVLQVANSSVPISQRYDHLKMQSHEAVERVCPAGYQTRPSN